MKIIYLTFTSIFILSNVLILSKETINSSDPIFSYQYMDCNELFVRTYDNLIHSEVDRTTAFATANEIWFECMLDQN